MDTGETQNFSDMDFDTCMSGADLMIETGIGSRHVVVETCLNMTLNMICGDLTGKAPDLRGSIAKLVKHKLKIQVSCDVEDFEPHVWFERIAATGATEGNLHTMNAI